MAGAFDWLDTLTQQTGDVLGRAVEAAGAVATAKIEAEQRRATIGDTTPAAATSPIQTARPGFVVEPQMALMLGIGVAVVIGAFVLLRK